MVKAGDSRGRYYKRLLLKMSWRVALLALLAIAVVMAAHFSPAYSEKELASAVAVTIALLVMIFLPAFFLVTWLQTKRKFTVPPQASTTIEQSATSRSVRHPTHSSLALAKALDTTDSSGAQPTSRLTKSRTNKPEAKPSVAIVRSTWWKRLIIVLEIVVFLVSATVAVLLWGELSLFALVVLLLLPAFAVHLLRIAIIYIVEGKKPFGR